MTLEDERLEEEFKDWVDKIDNPWMTRFKFWKAGYKAGQDSMRPVCVREPGDETEEEAINKG